MDWITNRFMNDQLLSCFHFFEKDISHITLPEKFTFPFYYTPHPLCVIAAESLQHYLENEFNEMHNFGLDKNQKGMIIGKMFGVMVVRNPKGELGHLWAFSGKLAEKNFLPHFVPPIYDTLNPDAHYKKMEKLLNSYNEQIIEMEQDKSYLDLKSKLEKSIQQSNLEIENFKQTIRNNKIIRDALRANSRNEEEFIQLSDESKREQIQLKHLKKNWKEKIAEIQHQIEFHKLQISNIKQKRKHLSNDTQKFIFNQYNFLNAHFESKNILKIFKDISPLPPSGAGECAAPKLLQYAFLHKLQPIAMCEFWWGESPPSEVRKHKHFYPSCRSKCEPILSHMLQGLEVDENPMLNSKDLSDEVKIIYEDNEILVVNKPTEMLSVPGKNSDAISLYDILRQKYPYATGPLLVHRLDMSTSGIVLIAKNKEVHENLQKQFIKRKVKKRYAAILDGVLEKKQGRIELPIRVDLDNRPRQLVCYQYGKMSVTDYEVIEEKSGYTKVFFYPITGRTHQLRLHAAHHLGMNCPIKGDDLYGTTEKRLYLHANLLEFTHPITKQLMHIECPEPF